MIGLLFINRKGWNTMELRTNIIGYHVNDKDRCERFISEKEYIICSEDVYWLGYGMYFWDNQANAEYWLDQKKRKEKNIKYIAQVKANIFIDNLLDLTDHNVLKTFDGLWEQYCRKEKISRNMPIGKKLDMLFDFLTILDTTYRVIRVFGKYEKDYERNFLIYKTKENETSIKLTNKIKTVYCVRSFEYACNRGLEEVFENEFYRVN